MRKAELAKRLNRIARLLEAGNIKSKTIFCDEREYGSKANVQKEYPSATKIVKVTGGWAVFETWTDYETWKKQK